MRLNLLNVTSLVYIWLEISLILGQTWLYFKFLGVTRIELTELLIDNTFLAFLKNNLTVRRAYNLLKTCREKEERERLRKQPNEGKTQYQEHELTEKVNWEKKNKVQSMMQQNSMKRDRRLLKCFKKLERKRNVQIAGRGDKW